MWITPPPHTHTQSQVAQGQTQQRRNNYWDLERKLGRSTFLYRNRGDRHGQAKTTKRVRSQRNKYLDLIFLPSLISYWVPEGWVHRNTLIPSTQICLLCQRTRRGRMIWMERKLGDIRHHSISFHTRILFDHLSSHRCRDFSLLFTPWRWRLILLYRFCPLTALFVSTFILKKTACLQPVLLMLWTISAFSYSL